jgi:hypothetical protein
VRRVIKVHQKSSSSYKVESYKVIYVHELTLRRTKFNLINFQLDKLYNYIVFFLTVSSKKINKSPS